MSDNLRRSAHEAASVGAAVAGSAQFVLRDPDSSGTSSALPQVLSEVPVAVVLVDLGTGLVTYANRPAIEMAHEPRLPVSLDAWGRAAGLRDLDGRPLESTANPLSRVATGQPVAGEAIRGRQPDGEDRLLWVTGFPLTPPASHERLSLIVLLDVETPDDAVASDRAMRRLRDRAVIATDLSFTISDPRQDDNPLVWVNPAFERVTGYRLEDVQGRNCRFLQGPGTDPAEVGRLRDAITAREPVVATLVNYRQDGTAFWNQVAITPVFDHAGELVSYVGVQADVTERKRVEDERERAYAAERKARERLALLADATQLLMATLDVDQTLAQLTELVVPQLADWAVINLVDDHGAPERVAIRDRDDRFDIQRRWAELEPDALTSQSLTRQVIERGEGVLVPFADASMGSRGLTSPELQEYVRTLGMASVMVVPLVARRRVLGAMAFVSADEDRRYTGEDLAVAEDLGRRAGMMIDNAGLYQREHRVAETLQRSLLPRIPPLPGVRVAVRYETPEDAYTQVGGDFYDVLSLPDSTIGLVCGDVVGHDVVAAAAMGQLRGMLRACAWDTAAEGGPDPGAVLERLDRVLEGVGEQEDAASTLATAVYGRLRRPMERGEPWELTWSSAGHPAPLVRYPDGSVALLDEPTDLLLGVDASTMRTSHKVALPSGSLLVAYTDGLVERRGEDISDSMASLAERLRQLPAADPHLVCGALVDSVGPSLDDDVAVLALLLS